MSKIILVLLLLLPISAVWGQSPLLFVYNEYPPFEYETEKGHTGISVEKIRIAAEGANIPLKFSQYPWSRALIMIQNRQADAIFSLFRTKEREKYLDYVLIPLSKVQDVIVSLSSSKFHIKTFDDLKNHKIGIIQDNSHGEIFDNLQGLNKDFSVSKDIFLIRKLIAKRLDIIVITKDVFHYLIKSHNFERSNFKIHPLIVNQEDLYLAFAKKGEQSQTLAVLFAEKLKDVKDNGTE